MPYDIQSVYGPRDVTVTSQRDGGGLGPLGQMLGLGDFFNKMLRYKAALAEQKRQEEKRRYEADLRLRQAAADQSAQAQDWEQNQSMRRYDDQQRIADEQRNRMVPLFRNWNGGSPGTVPGYGGLTTVQGPNGAAAGMVRADEASMYAQPQRSQFAGYEGASGSIPSAGEDLGASARPSPSPSTGRVAGPETADWYGLNSQAQWNALMSGA